jgi:glycerophosphoryl diester phosphodiesterase
VGLGFDSVQPRFIQDLHAHGLVIFVYTLNDPRDISQARALGIDGIISDYPDRV